MTKLGKLIIGIIILGLIVTGWFWLKANNQPPEQSNALQTSTPPTETTHSMTQTALALPGGKTIILMHPDDYTISVAAMGFARARFMAKSPDGRLFVGEMYNASDTTRGRVLVLSNFGSATNSFKTTNIYLANLRNPNSVNFYTDSNNQTWIYIALTDKLIRYKYSAGDIAPEGAPETVATFPDTGNTVAEGGWHITRTVIFHNDKLYVSVGSSCNSCEEKTSEPDRASILVMNPDGTNQQIYANGLRNAVGIEFVGDQLYATENNADQLGNDRPNDELYKIAQGTNYGWPYCYQFNGQILPDNSQSWKNNFDCGNVPLAFAALEPHSAPLGFEYFDGHFLVAEHGSGQKTIGNGYKVVSVSSNGQVSDFLTGFLTNGTVVGRPVDVYKNDDKSFFVTDDYNGVIYYMQKTD